MAAGRYSLIGQEGSIKTPLLFSWTGDYFFSLLVGSLLMGSIFSFFMAFISLSMGRSHFDSELLGCLVIQLFGRLQTIGLLKCLQRGPGFGTHSAVDRSGIVALAFKAS